MNFNRTIRDLLLGKEWIVSRSEYKSSMLRGYMSLIAATVGITYTIIDYRNGLTAGLVYYAVVIVVAFLTILLTRKRYFQTANILFLTASTGVIFLFAASDTHRTGVHMFFISTGLVAFVLFGFQKIHYALIFSALLVGIFFLSYSGQPMVMDPLPNQIRLIRVNFSINFFISFFACVLIVYSLITINHHSEQEILTTSTELRKSRERNQQVLEAVHAGIYEWHPIENYIYVSTSWKKIIGYTAEELPDVSVEFYYSLVHPDDYASVQKVIADHIKTKEPYRNELRLKKKNGEYVWVMDSGITKFDEYGKPLVTVGSIIDINEQKLVEDKVRRQNDLLLKTNKELDQFVYSVSHDLRAPLSSILGLTNIYQLSRDQKERESIVKMINERATTLDAFISEILDYSRNARTEVKEKCVNVSELTAEVLKGMSYINGHDRISIKTEIDPTLAVNTDRGRVKIILNNIIGNAIKYSDLGKESFIYVTSYIKDNEWIIEIKDNGIGIKAEHQEKIFDMFYQAHERGHGSGLGLYIVMEAVNRLKGTVKVWSEFTVGSTFTISLPVSEADRLRR
jgi:PAS domain S-box-containing protein